MTRAYARTAALALAVASTATAQQPGPRGVGVGGPGVQPQVGAGAYQGFVATPPATRGVNPFAGPAVLPTLPPGMRLTPRQGGAPVAFQPPAPGVPNNPAVFNPGVPPAFPLQIPPPMPVVNGVSYNPLFVSRRGVVSAYYVPPTAVRSPSLVVYPGEEAFPQLPDTGPGFVPPAGEYHFLPWIW